MKSFFVLVFLATISSADLQLLRLTCTHLQFDVSYSLPSSDFLLQSLAISYTDGFNKDIFSSFRSVRSRSVILPVPSSMTGGSNCTLRGNYFEPIKFQVFNFADASCNNPATEMSLPAEVSANISESTSINCNVTSSHYVNITWMKAGYALVAESYMEINETFLDNSPNSLVSISIINFSTLQSSDSGWYNCSMASTKSKSSVSSSVYLSIQKGPTSSTEQFTAIYSTTDATTSEGNNKDVFNYRVFLTSIGILLAVFIMVTFCVAVLLVYCSRLKTIRKEKMDVQDFANRFPNTHEEKDLDLTNMKTMVTISQSTPSLCVKLNTGHHRVTSS